MGTYFLGIGLVPSTLNATILTVTVIDDDIFNEVFGSTVQFNNEGEIVAVGGGTPAEGIPFTETAVRRILETEPMAASGAARLALTWRHLTLRHKQASGDATMGSSWIGSPNRVTDRIRRAEIDCSIKAHPRDTAGNYHTHGL